MIKLQVLLSNFKQQVKYLLLLFQQVCSIRLIILQQIYSLNNTFQRLIPNLTLIQFSILSITEYLYTSNCIQMNQQRVQKKHTACKYGASCKMQDTCWYSHSISTQFQSNISGQTDINENQTNSSKLSKSGKSGSSQMSATKGSHVSQGSSKVKQKSDIRNNKKCKYGQECKNKLKCNFRHPGDPKIQKQKQQSRDEFYLEDIQSVSQSSTPKIQVKNRGTYISDIQGNPNRFGNRFSYDQFSSYQSCLPNQQLVQSNCEYPDLNNESYQQQIYQQQGQPHLSNQLQQQQMMKNEYPNFYDNGNCYQYQHMQQNPQLYQVPNIYQWNQQWNYQGYQQHVQLSENNSQRQVIHRSRTKIFKTDNLKKVEESQSESSLSGQSQDQKQLIFKKNKHPKEPIKNQKPRSQKKIFTHVKDLFEKMTLTHKPQDIALSNLHSFFVKYHVSQQQKEKIIELIQQKKLTPQKIGTMIYILDRIVKGGFKQYFGFITLVKMIIKKKFQQENILKKLNQAKNPIIKKRGKEAELYKRFPNPQPIQFLQLSELQQLNSKKTIFLIDGNNVLVTNGKFRKYFQSKDELQKVEAQIRLHWILGQTLQGYLFFDDEYVEEIRNYVQQQFMTPEQQKFLIESNTGIKVLYARKKEDKKATADQRIVAKLIQLHNQLQKYSVDDMPEIILVSADRILTQQCLQIRKIKKTSGKQFIKYCKKQLKNKYYSDSSKKGIIKKIFTYRF